MVVQGHRKVGGVKGFKLFVEKFFQPYIEMVVENSKEQIDLTKNLLGVVNKGVTPENEQEGVSQGVKEVEEKTQKKATFVAENIFNDLVRQVSNTIKEAQSITYDCEECDGVFILKEKLTEHIQRIHTEKVQQLSFQCEQCVDMFTVNEEMTEHI